MDEPPVARSESERAVQFALETVGRRERTVAELRGLLERRGFSTSAIEAAVAELEVAGFLDDARYARRFAEDKRELERWGSVRIAQELQRRGIASELVEAVVESRAKRDELASALVLLGERIPNPPEDDRERDRAWRLLVRRGYQPEVAYAAVRAHARRAAA
jgi:regulatory protein